MIRKKNNKVVYRHIRLDNNEVFYIGMGYFKRAYSTDLSKRDKIWKDIVNKTDYIVEILAENLSWEDACELEILLISQYGRKNIKTGTLANLTDGGDGSKGCSPSQETRDKISKIHKGKIVTDETRKKLSDKKKDIYNLSKNPRAKKVINIETGEIFNCAKEAAIHFKICYTHLIQYINHKEDYKFQYI